MLKSVLYFFLGTVTIQATGNTERFLNELYRREIKIHSLKKTDHLSISFSVSKRKLRLLYPVANFSHTKLEIIKNTGLFHLFRGYKKRYGIVVGTFIFALSFYVLSLFVWNVEIAGCLDTTPQEVSQMLKSAGFASGKLKSSLNIKKIENEFLKNNSKISWISINLKGTTAYIEIREIDPAPDIIDTSEPCSIYAARDGVIASVHTYMGYSVVSPGNTVTAGDLVVTGNYTDKYGEQYKLHSYAKVMAYTTHTHTVTLPLKKTEHIKTGKIQNKYSLKFISFVIPLYFNKNIRYNNYDITTSEKQIRFGKNISFPISIVKTTYTEVEKVPSVITEEVALKDAYEKLYDFEYNLVGIVVNDRRYEKKVDEDSLTVKVILDCYEDIGIKGKLD